jgi:putative transposase
MIIVACGQFVPVLSAKRMWCAPSSDATNASPAVGNVNVAMTCSPQNCTKRDVSAGILPTAGKETSMKQRYSEEQIIRILQEAEATTDRPALLRKYAISEWTFYRWRKRFGGLQVPEAKRLKQLEDENSRLKRVLADQLLANQALREVLEIKGGGSDGGPRGCRASSLPRSRRAAFHLPLPSSAPA